MAVTFLGTIVTVAISVVLITFMRQRAQRSMPSTEFKEITERLARMEQAIDAMAVETERISEGQRFTTKLMSERSQVRSGE